ncbi:hypothetical protein ACFSMW_13355 [Virgibacillus halophilus]|uniref:Uncharacterized protein n=1 Tax=Tigheibacillus halophilus TaxID=361280 RepID=A0ABU5C9Q8_9BACI|nr:hypothetical protein [Virgibacillus halophilus]
MTAVLKMEDMRKRRQYDRSEKDWGLVKCFCDLELNFSIGVLRDITNLWEDGHDVEDIAEATKRDPDEIFLALFEQSRHGKTKRPFGRRI